MHITFRTTDIKLVDFNERTNTYVDSAVIGNLKSYFDMKDFH